MNIFLEGLLDEKTWTFPNFESHLPKRGVVDHAVDYPNHDIFIRTNIKLDRTGIMGAKENELKWNIGSCC